NALRIPSVPLDPLSLRRLRTLIHAWKPDILQAHGGEPLKYAVAAVLKRAAPAVIYRRIGSVTDDIARWPRRAAYAVIMRRANRIVAVAGVLKREPSHTLRAAPCGVVTVRDGVRAR